MAIELKRDFIGFYKERTKVCSNIEETMEVIVFDTLPDILRVLETDGRVCVSNIINENGLTRVVGNVDVSILYTSEDNDGIFIMKTTIPFEKTVESKEFEENVFLDTCVSLQSIETRTINPRKVLLRARMQTQSTVYDRGQTGYTEDIVADEKIEIKKASREFDIISDMKHKEISIEEELEISDAYPEIKQLVKCNVCAETTECKIVGNKAVIKGNAKLDILYQSEMQQELQKLNYDLPYSQIIEIDLTNEEDICKAYSKVMSITAEPVSGVNGENRIVAVSIALDTVVKAISHKYVSYVEDVFAIDKELEIKSTVNTVENFPEILMKNVSVREKVETGVTPKSCISADYTIWPTNVKTEDGKCVLSTEVTVGIIYYGEDGRIYSINKRIPIECRDNSKKVDGCFASCKISDFAVSQGLDVSFVAEFEVVYTKHESIACVDDLSIVKELQKIQEGAPSVVVKYVSENEDIWSIGKIYHCSIEDIKQANNLTIDEISTGLLLVPVKYQ